VSDARRRALERRFQDSGAVADAAALLRERVRAGELSEARARLAAALGEPAARELEPDARDPAAALADADREAQLRGLVAVAHRERVALRRRAPAPHTRRAREDAYEAELAPAAERALRAVEAWAVAPGTGGGQVAARLADLTASLDAEGRSSGWFGLPSPRQDAVRAHAEAVARLARAALDEASARHLDAASGPLRELLGEDALRVALRAELLPWLLGDGDPLAERVARRRGAQGSAESDS